MQEILRSVELFSDLSDADLERLCESIEEVRVEDGTTLFHEGDPGDSAYVIKAGALEIVKQSSGRDVLLAIRGPGEVIGEMALLEDAPRMATARARGDTLLLAIDQKQLDDLVQTSGSAARAMFYTVLARWRSTGTMLRQSEKMAQLGTLTAGVAHELNNPAAAVQRGVGQLGDAVHALGEARARLETLRADPVAWEAAERWGRRAEEGAPEGLDALAQSDLEAELEDWLDGNGVQDAWELSPALAALGWDSATLDELTADVPEKCLAPVLRWVAARHTVADLLNEVSQGSHRISEIVKALKGYAYLDQAPIQDVDVHEGLESTLVILRSKLKKGITVRKEFATGLPRIQAWGSELNQVWTNLIDNAVDAMGGEGTLTLRTRAQDGWVVVEVEDDGPGIPKEAKDRIFDAFFTTKPPGQGTGLGLDISYRIVVLKHRGDIKVSSRPGRTGFSVWLPVDSEGSAAGVPGLARPSDAVLGQILADVHTVAVVGISEHPDRPSHTVPRYLQRHGYQIVPVNPSLDEVLGERAWPSLKAIPDPVDAVLVFRRPEAVPAIVEDAIAIGARVVWMQEGIVHEAAAARATEAGLTVVMDTCMRATHQRIKRGS